MHTGSALRKIRVTILIFFLRNRLGSIKPLRPFLLNIRECRGCPFSFQACFCTVESIAERSRINDEQQITALYAVSLLIRNPVHVARHPGPHIDGIDGLDTSVEFVRQTNWLGLYRRKFYCRRRRWSLVWCWLTSRKRDCQSHRTHADKQKLPGRCSTYEQSRLDQTSCCVIRNSRRNAHDVCGSLLFCIRLAHGLPPRENRPRRYTSRYLYLGKDASIYWETVRTLRHVSFCPGSKAKRSGRTSCGQSARCGRPSFRRSWLPRGNHERHCC